MASNLERELLALANLKDVSITLGVHSEEGAEQYEGGATIAEIATYHENGWGVPRRSWLADFFTEKREAVEALTDSTIARVTDKGVPVAQAFDGLALQLAGKIQARFQEGIGPALAEVTIRRKGSSKQLIDTGIFRGSITGKVELP